MDNNELLLAISDMMDQKLDSVHVRMDTMENKLDAKIDAVENRLDAKIDAVEHRLSADINALDGKIDAVEHRLSADINALDGKIDAVDERLSQGIRDINITLENVVIPRISHIEQCYLDTSERYTKETGRINGLVADVQVIKSVVQNHSEQLRKIS